MNAFFTSKPLTVSPTSGVFSANPLLIVEIHLNRLTVIWGNNFGVSVRKLGDKLLFEPPHLIGLSMDRNDVRWHELLQERTCMCKICMRRERYVVDLQVEGSRKTIH